MNLSFDQLITFSRTSAATYVNSAGNVVRTPASKNLLLWTEDFDNAVWTKSNVTVTGNNAVGPDGRSTADTLSETTTNSGHVVSIAGSATAAAHTFSVYLKKGGGASAPDWVQLYTGATSTLYANFNLSTGAVGNVAAGATAAISAAGNGWYRCSLTFTPTAGSAALAVAFTNNLDTTTRGPSYAGNTAADVLAWGAQLELGSTATSYVKNDGGLFPARFDYDPATLAPKGLLIESQRTNLLLRSEEFDDASWAKNAPVSITANYAVSPDGTVDADRFVSTGGAFPQVGQSVALTAGQPYTFSVWVKSDGTSQIQQTLLLDGSQTNFTPTATWTRISVTVASSAGGSKSAVIATNNPAAAASSFLIWGAQVELGSFATSYIPTAGSQVTRTADVASIVAPNFAPWYNQSEGTFVFELTPKVVPLGVNARMLEVNDGTGNNRNPLVYASSAGTLFTQYRVAGVDQASLSSSTGYYVAGNNLKLSTAYKVNDFATSFGGSVATTDTSGSVVTTATQLTIGYATSDPAGVFNGHIRSIRYFPTRLSNAQLQALSA